MRKSVKVCTLSDLYDARRVFEYQKREAEIKEMMYAGYAKSYLIQLHRENWLKLTAGGVGRVSSVA